DAQIDGSDADSALDADAQDTSDTADAKPDVPMPDVPFDTKPDVTDTGPDTKDAAPITYAVTVTLGGDGTGAVTSSDGAISCGTACTKAYAPGATVALVAKPTKGSGFAGWTGDCTGPLPSCIVK